MGEVIKMGGERIPATAGSAGLLTQQYGGAVTVDGVAAGGSGLGRGGLMERAAW